MTKPRDWMPVALTAGALAGTGLALTHSLRTRGARRTAIFAALGMGLPLAGEFGAVNALRVIRHRMRPQVYGVPLAAVAWYTIGYTTFALVDDLLEWARVDGLARSLAAPVGTAAVATSLDLIFDCFGLDLGLWEWRDGGSYGRDIVGPNGKPGIPVANFAGWVALTGGVSLGYELLVSVSTSTTESSPQAHKESGRTGGGTAALLLAPYYLGSAAWAVARRKPQYLAYSALFPAALLAALLRSTRPRLRPR